MESDGEKLDFAYKYPFTKEAKEVVGTMNQGLDEKFIKAGKIRVEEALNNSQIKFEKTNLAALKTTYLLSYVYSRMLVSALNDRYLISRYADAEAKRASEALADDSVENMTKVAKELSIEITYDKDFKIRFEKYLEVAPRLKEFSLANQNLASGYVYVPKAEFSKLVANAIRMSIMRGLPIPSKDLPQEIVKYSKMLKVPKQKVTVDLGKDAKRYEWIEKLLQTPIADVRHRTVNLILAPYLTNVKKMDEEAAANAITDYIERCKQINPDTRINATYIRYQCKYSKNKGMKPLSLTKAKELLKSVVELNG